jgi:hypothetical protein
MKSSGGDAEYIALLCDLVFAIRSMHHRRRRITANHGVYHVRLQVYERQPAQAMVGWTRHRQRFLGSLLLRFGRYRRAHMRAA